MALYTPYTLTDLNQQARQELMDPVGQWWPDTELNQYINDWQQLLQSQMEFVWSSATFTMSFGLTGMASQWGIAVWGTSVFGGTSTSSGSGISPTINLPGIDPNMLRCDAIYYSPGGTDTAVRRLYPRLAEDIERIAIDWRSQGSGILPEVVYPVDAQTVGIWPPPTGTGTYIFEYPVLLTMTTGSDAMRVPAWTRYGATPYVAYRALARFGPNQDLQRAMRYRKRHEDNFKMYRRTYDAYLPEHSPMLRPIRRFGRDILIPRQFVLQRP